MTGLVLLAMTPDKYVSVSLQNQMMFSVLGATVAQLAALFMSSLLACHMMKRLRRNVLRHPINWNPLLISFGYTPWLFEVTDADAA